MTLKLALSGARGRMGSLVARLAAEDPAFEVVQVLEDESHPEAGKRMAIEGLPGEWVLGNALEPGADVLVDFTNPAGFRKMAVECVKTKTALVTGTTGLSKEDEDLLVDASSQIPALHAANMSMGVAVLSRAVSLVAGLLPEGFDAEIVEAHHRNKADAPSGTALKLAKILKEGGRWSQCIGGREGAVGPRTEGELGIHAVRGGDVVGEHTVLFLGPAERIELTHRCTDRSVFVRGALRLAEKIVGCDPGLYRISDLL